MDAAGDLTGSVEAGNDLAGDVEQKTTVKGSTGASDEVKGEFTGNFVYGATLGIQAESARASPSASRPATPAVRAGRRMSTSNWR